MPKKVRPIPKGFTTVTPSLTQENSAATMDFCKKAFGARTRSRVDGPGGKIMHAEIVIGNAIVMLTDAGRDPAQAADLYLYVPDVDKTFAKAVKAGATALMAPQDMFWGDRFARVVDPAGNKWGLATHREDVTPRELKKRLAAMTAG